MAICDKVVLISGASSGIGEATAVYLASIGYKKLALIARREKELNKVAEKCKEKGAEKVLVLAHDLQSEDSNRLCVEETISTFGRLDVLLANAGCAIGSTVRDMTSQDWDTTMGLNLKSCFLLTKYSLPHLEKTRGNIVYNSSAAGTHPLPMHTSYSTSKAALNMFARCVAKEEAPKGIRVNVVAPGYIINDLALSVIPQEITASGKTQEERYSLGRQFLSSQQPLGIVGDMDNISRLFAFIMSEESSYMTGSIVTMDGGYLLAPGHVHETADGKK